ADNLKHIFGIVRGHLDKLVKDEEAVASAEDRKSVAAVVQLFSNIAVNEPIKPIFRDLARSYLRLMLNWNIQLGKIPNLNTTIAATLHIVEGQMTMLETIRLMKNVSARLKVFNQFEPPVFKLSRHYLKTLPDKEEAGEARSDNKKD
ncbi:unnamed protein product, partial [marine sediment metagenome]